MEWSPLNTCARPSNKENSIGSILGSEKGKRTTPRGLFWAQWDTQARPAAAFWKKLTSESSIGSQESLIPDTYPPFIGSWPLSHWLILEKEHTHTWLIIFGKYLNNLGVRQERTKVVKSMLDWTKTGTGSRALRVCDKELSKSLNLSGPGLPNKKYHLSYRNGIKISQTLVKCCGYSEKDPLCTDLCTSLCFTMSDMSEKDLFLTLPSLLPAPRKGFCYYHWSHGRVSQ